MTLLAKEIRHIGTDSQLVIFQEKGWWDIRLHFYPNNDWLDPITFEFCLHWGRSPKTVEAFYWLLYWNNDSMIDNPVIQRITQRVSDEYGRILAIKVSAWCTTITGIDWIKAIHIDLAWKNLRTMYGNIAFAMEQDNLEHPIMQ